MSTIQSPLPPTETERRVTLLATGGVAGFAIWTSSLILAYLWRSTIFGGLEAWQGSNWWQLWVWAMAMYGGLAIMFISLMPARAVAHSNVALRRLLYGYNAVLTGQLVLSILLFVNVLVYNYYTASYDWTESSIYTLTDRSKSILRALDKPTRVYALVPASDDLAYREIHTLLDNCRAINDKIQVEYVSPDLDVGKVRELTSRYQLNERGGLLVLYGTDPQVDQQFIKYSDLFGNDPDRTSKPGKARFFFKGEDALISALSFLEEGKVRATVYFTQGNGELDIGDTDAAQEGRGLGVLRERLEKGNYQVKGLQFGPTPSGKAQSPITIISTKVPADADVVVVAGPRSPLPDYALKALRDYLSPGPDVANKKKGKLVVLLDTVLDLDKNLVRTGLEGLLGEFNIQVDEDRVLTLPNNLNRGDPLRVAVTSDPRSTNPVAAPFRGIPFLMSSLRTVKARSNTPPGPAGSQYRVDTLLLALPSTYVWAETNLRADPVQIANDLLKNGNEEELEKKLSRTPLSVAVTVSEPQAPAGNDPHAFMQSGEQKPRMVVFGSSVFASNPYMLESRSSTNYELFSSSLAWLRERPSNIGLEPKKRNVFMLNVSDDVVQRMRWVPAVIFFTAIVGLGTGVWLIRRR